MSTVFPAANTFSASSPEPNKSFGVTLTSGARLIALGAGAWEGYSQRLCAGRAYRSFK